jgi:hypothetical protein
VIHSRSMINVGAPGEGVGSSLLAVRERAESKSPCTALDCNGRPMDLQG